MGNLGKMALIDQTKKFRGQDSIGEEKKLLVQNVNEDYDILKQLGLNDRDLDAELESFGEYKRISELSEDWGYCVSKDVLEKIAYDHNLTLGESKYYKYSVPVTITSDIKDWTKKTGVNLSDGTSFFILAPSESFYNYDEYRENNHKTKSAKKTTGDPMLVYEIVGSQASGGSVYSLITEWGKDLNPLRKIKAYVVNRAKTFANIATWFLIALITTIAYQVTNSLTLGHVGNDWVTIVVSLFTLVGMVIVLYPLTYVRVTNIRRSKFDINNLERNFQKIKLFEYSDHHGVYYASELFAEIIARFLIVGAVNGFLFFVFFVSSDKGTSFAQDLGYSGWYFTIPMGVIIVGFLGSIISNVFKKLDW